MITLNQFRTLAAVFVVGLFASTNAYAQASASATATASATIAKPITITKTADLSFGTIVPNGTGNGALTVTVDTADTRSIAGNVDGALLGGTVSSAAFNVTGRPNATYALTLPAAPFNITGTNTGATMSVGGFTESTGAGGGTLVVGATPGLGEHAFKVGATLTVGETQAADSYTGSLSVTVAYN